MDDDKKIIRFDWAVKRMLRDKANSKRHENFVPVVRRYDLD